MAQQLRLWVSIVIEKYSILCFFLFLKEEARYELEQFFQQTEHGRCKGWLLLKATFFLSEGDAVSIN